MKVGEKKVLTVTDKTTGELKDRITFEVHESRAFDYGNRTGVSIESETGFVLEEYYDTRYYSGNLEQFVAQIIDEKYNTDRFAFK